MGKYSVTIRDRSGELSNVGFNIGFVTTLNLTAQLTNTGNLKNAIDAITLGVIARDEMKVYTNDLDASLPVSPYANRESKFLVRYHDSTAAVSTFEIPAPDLAMVGLLQSGTDFINLLQPEIDDFVQAFQTAALSPAGNAVVVDSIEIVGRNI